MNRVCNNFVVLGLGPESGTRYDDTNVISGLAADLPIWAGCLFFKRENINKGMKATGYIIIAERDLGDGITETLTKESE